VTRECDRRTDRRTNILIATARLTYTLLCQKCGKNRILNYQRIFLCFYVSLADLAAVRFIDIDMPKLIPFIWYMAFLFSMSLSDNIVRYNIVYVKTFADLGVSLITF